MKLTLEFLKEKNACKSGIEWFEKQDKGLSLQILANKAIEDGRGSDCFWVMARIIKDKISFVKIAVFAAELVIDIFEEKCPNDKRPRKAIEAAKKYIDDPSEENRVSAASAARAAADAASAARAAADAAYTAYTASDAAYAAYVASAAASVATAAYVAYVASAAASAATAAYVAYVANTSEKRKEIQKQVVDYALQFVK